MVLQLLFSFFLLGWLLHMFFLCHVSSFSVCQKESSEGMLHAGLEASAIFSKGCLDGLQT